MVCDFAETLSDTMTGESVTSEIMLKPTAILTATTCSIITFTFNHLRIFLALAEKSKSIL